MRKIIYLMVLVGGVALLAAPNSSLKIDKKLWLKVDSLEGEGLYRSALLLCDKIYTQAREEADAESEIKALIYRLKYTQELDEDGQQAAILLLEKELPDERLVQGSIKNSMLAELYYRYYSANRWQISQNPMEDDGSGKPLKNWSPERFYRFILDQYESSLKNEDQLSKIKVGSLPDLWSGNLADTVNKPTLFDVLVSRAIGFVENSAEFTLPDLKPAIYCSPDLFVEPGPLLKAVSLSDQEGRNPFYRSLKWYELWLKKTDSQSFVTIELRRLRYLYDQSCNLSRDSLYESGLRRLSTQKAADSTSAAVYEALAVFHLERANLYQINNADTQKYKLDRKRAAEWLKLSSSWPNTLAGKRCENLRKSLMKPELSVLTEAYQLPLQPFPVSVEYRNLKTLYYKIYKMNAVSYYTGWDELEPAEKLNKSKALPTFRTGKMILPDDGDLNPHRVNGIMDPLPAGFYLVLFSDEGKTNSTDNLIVALPLSVTQTNWISRQGKSAVWDFYFRNRDTGEPIENLTIVPWYALYDQQAGKSIFERGKPGKSGAEGFIEIPDGSPGTDQSSPKAYRLEIIDKKDTLVTREMFYPGYHQGNTVTRTSLVLYTDRSLYKPGDEIRFRGVLLDYIGDSMAIHQADSIELTLQDPRYQVVAKIVRPVDSLGVFTGSIKLPFKGLTGQYQIQSRFGQTTVRMEQYKRPAFSINIERGSDIFLPGQKMKIAGTISALSGEPVPEASVLCEIDLQPGYSPRRWSPFTGQKIRIATVKTISDQNGHFSCDWMAIPEGSSPFGHSPFDRYAVNIKVTDLNGETHQEATNLDCGRASTSLSLQLPGRISTTDTLNGQLGAGSSDGRNLRVPVRLKIHKLTDPDQIWKEPALPDPDRFAILKSDWQKKLKDLPFNKEHLPSSWPVASMIMEKDYPNDSTTRIAVQPSGKWQQGWYKVELIPVDPAVAKSVTKFIYVEEANPERIGPDETLYASVSSAGVKTGQTLGFSYASGQKGFLLIELRKGGNDPITGWYPVGSKVNDLKWTVSNDWQGGAMIHAIMFRSNRVYEKNFPITIPWENSVLKISGLDSLNLVKPGDSVTLRLKSMDENGAPVRASIGVTVYDASLDLILPHQWITITRPVFADGPVFGAVNAALAGSFLMNEPAFSWIDVPGIEAIDLNWFGLGYYGISRTDAPMLKMAMARPEGARGGAIQDTERKIQAAEVSEDVNQMSVEQEVNRQGSPLMIRSDFRETAAFQGNILTDMNGMAILKFRVPDVFTEWKVLATAHDNKLAFGNMEKRFKSTQELMLKANFPGFMRLGDTVELAARLGWYGKGTIETQTSLVLSDSTGNPLQSYPALNSKLDPGGVAAFYWPFIAKNRQPINYLVKSESAGPSDALKDSIRVYPDQVQLWTAQPFFFSKPGKKTLQIEGKPIEATFEVTTTPAWQILQSLPVVNKKERDCSEYWFSRLYLTCLTGSIADKFPEVTRKFLSDSVPENQKDRINQIRDWMEPESRGREMAYVLEKLSNLQNQDGTWPWYKGMGSDLFMTQQIVAGFGEMKSWGVFDVTRIQRGNYMVTHAIEALDNWLYREFREVLRRDSLQPQKVQLNPMIIHYLYTRSYYTGLTLSPANELAWIYFTDRIPVEWTQHGPGLQALMAITCVQLGRKPDAMPVFNSLRERAITDEQWGIHWPRKGYGTAWYDWDLWMQSRMIELFAVVEEGHKDLDQLKLYLIHQKRGRDWGNGLIAAWASKSLLFYGSDLLIRPAMIGMTWGNEKYSPLRVKTGSIGVTGYYRFEWKRAEEMPKSKTVEVVQTEGGPAWGTLFTLNNYQLDQLSATGGPLKIKRDVMVRNGLTGWQQLGKGQPVKKGDLIRIRLSVQSDRELSYIEIRDFLGTGFVPVRILSGYQYHDGLSYYQSREPESVVCYVPQLPKGISTIEYQAVIEQAGNYFGGYATATSLYAPEFRGWSDSFRINAKR